MCYLFCGSSSSQILQLSMFSMGWGLGNLTRAQVPFSYRPKNNFKASMVPFSRHHFDADAL